MTQFTVGKYGLTIVFLDDDDDATANHVAGCLTRPYGILYVSSTSRGRNQAARTSCVNQQYSSAGPLTRNTYLERGSTLILSTTEQRFLDRNACSAYTCPHHCVKSFYFYIVIDVAPTFPPPLSKGFFVGNNVAPAATLNLVKPRFISNLKLTSGWALM